MKKRRANDGKADNTASDFYVEAEYADSILRTALGDSEGAVSRLKRALELKPTYAPAILSMGSVEYQRGRRAQGRRLFRSLLSLPEDTPGLCEIIDEAGSFLIQIGAYKHGLALFGKLPRDFLPSLCCIRVSHAVLVTRGATTRR
jgi:tetratricopeptide (TPR) repeat protein